MKQNTESKAYTEGRIACANLIPREDNPHLDTNSAEDWNAGWDKAISTRQPVRCLVPHREMQIMMMVTSCQKVSEISLSLHLSPKTVNSYRYRIFDKLKVNSDIELVLLAVKHGIVQNLARSALPAPLHKQAGKERTVA